MSLQSIRESILDETDKLSQNELLALQLQLLRRTHVQHLKVICDELHALLSVDLISDLPMQISLEILSYLDAISLCAVSQCCSRYRELANDDQLWYKLCISKGYTQYESLSFPDVDQEYRSSSPKYKVQEFLKHGCFGYWKTVYIKSTVLLHNWSHGLYNVSALNAGHKEPITAMSLKDDVMVTGSRDGSSKVFDLKSLSIVTSLKGHTDEINSILITEEMILSGCSDGVVRGYSLTSGQLIWSLEVKSGSVEALDYDRPYLVSAVSNLSIYIWRLDNISTPIAVDALHGHSESITCLRVKEQNVFSGSWDGTIRIWNIDDTNSTNTHILPAHLEGVMCILILSNNNLASGGGDSLVKIWEPVTGQLLMSLKGHHQEILCLQHDESVLISSSADSTIRIWDVNTGCCIHVLENHIGLVRCLILRENHLISGGDRKRINVWNKKTGRLLHTVHRQQNLIRLMETSKTQIITASPNEGIMGVISYW